MMNQIIRSGKKKNCFCSDTMKTLIKERSVQRGALTTFRLRWTEMISSSLLRYCVCLPFFYSSAESSYIHIKMKQEKQEARKTRTWSNNQLLLLTDFLTNTVQLAYFTTNSLTNLLSLQHSPSSWEVWKCYEPPTWIEEYDAERLIQFWWKCLQPELW